MARSTASSSSKSPTSKSRSAAAATTPVRKTSIPKAQPTTVAASSKTVTHEMIARRAYEISQSPSCGSEFDNWVRAERELRGK